MANKPRKTEPSSGGVQKAVEAANRMSRKMSWEVDMTSRDALEPIEVQRQQQRNPRHPHRSIPTAASPGLRVCAHSMRACTRWQGAHACTHTCSLMLASADSIFFPAGCRHHQQPSADHDDYNDNRGTHAWHTRARARAWIGVTG